MDKIIEEFYGISTLVGYLMKKLVTVVEGDQMVPFSIASTPGRRGGRYSYPRTAPLYPWYVPYIAEC